MRRILTLALATMTALATMGLSAGAAEVSSSLVSVVHGIPGATVDVYVNDNLFLEDFEPEDVAGPVALPAGTYDIAIFAANADPNTDAPVIDAPGVAVPAGINAAVVAHLDASGTPTASVFVNDVSEAAAGDARLTIRHTAEAPEVDVYANGAVDLTPGTFVNGEESVIDVAAGTYDVTVTAPGDASTVLAPLGDVTLAAGVNTIVYAIGTYPATFTVVVDSVAGVGPDGIFTDDNASVHAANIDQIARLGITLGCNPPDNTEFCPDRDVTRGEMAAFLVRSLGLPSTSSDYFPDDAGSTFEGDINALAEAGITTGRSDGTYGPNDLLTRGEMAAFLNRAFVDAPGAGDTFTDDDNSIFEADIEAIAAAGITLGCNPPANDQFCPDRNLIRAEMATFLARALGIGS
ncbi:MAG: DUF4397 domain-containing protein [Acidimicrobiia bacterium]|jgi:hypothetical protein